jgi:hypothetical protein
VTRLTAAGSGGRSTIDGKWSGRDRAGAPADGQVPQAALARALHEVVQRNGGQAGGRDQDDVALHPLSPVTSLTLRRTSSWTR